MSITRYNEINGSRSLIELIQNPDEQTLFIVGKSPYSKGCLRCAIDINKFELIATTSYGNFGAYCRFRSQGSELNPVITVAEFLPNSNLGYDELGYNFQVEFFSGIWILDLENCCSIGDMRTVRDTFEGHTINPYGSPEIIVNDKELVLTQELLYGPKIILKIAVEGDVSFYLNENDHTLKFEVNKNSNPEIKLNVLFTTSYPAHATYSFIDIFSDNLPNELVNVAKRFELLIGALELTDGTPATIIEAGIPRFQNLFGRDTCHMLNTLAPYLQSKFLVDCLVTILTFVSSSEIEHHILPEQLDIIRMRLGSFPHEMTPPNYPFNPDNPEESKFRFDFKMTDTGCLYFCVLINCLKDNLEIKKQFYAKLKDILPLNGYAEAKTYGNNLGRGVLRIIEDALPFYYEPKIENLIGEISYIRTLGEQTELIVGNGWRDGEGGEFNAKYLFSHNAGHIIGALEAIKELLSDELFSDPLLKCIKSELPVFSNLLKFAIVDLDKEKFILLISNIIDVWKEKSHELFIDTIPNSELVAATESFCQSYGFKAPKNSRGTDNLELHMFGIKENESKVRILSSDHALICCLTDPNEVIVSEFANSLLHNYPYGLAIPNVGIAIMVPLTTDKEIIESSNPKLYQGASWWGLVEVHIAEALVRQLNRNDLSSDTRSLLIKATNAFTNCIDPENPDKNTHEYLIPTQIGDLVKLVYREAPDAMSCQLQGWTAIRPFALYRLKSLLNSLNLW
jgi:hypothetical protein